MNLVEKSLIIIAVLCVRSRKGMGNPMTYSRSIIVSKLNSVIQPLNLKEFKKNLTILVKNDPNWLEIMLENKIIPDPYNITSGRDFILVMSAIAEMATHINAEPYTIANFLISSLSMSRVFHSITESFDALEIWNEPGEQILFEALTFVEDQSHLMRKEVDKQIGEQGYFDGPNAFFAETHRDEHGRKGSLLGSFETLCEIFQLLASEVYKRYAGQFKADILQAKSPYYNETLTKTFRLIHVWRIYSNLWERIKYQGWVTRSIRAGGTESAVIFEPSDKEEFLRYVVSSIREAELTYEIGASFAHTHLVGTSKGEYEELYKSITVPAKGQIWDGDINHYLLRKIWSSDPRRKLEELYLDTYHFSPILEKLDIGTGDKTIKWKPFYEIRQLLDVLAEAFVNACGELSELDGETAIYRRVVIVSKPILSNLIQSITNMDRNIIDTAVDWLLFNPDRRNLEIWDTPLLSIGQNLLIMCPNLIWAGSSFRAAENFIEQWSPALFAERGNIFEDDICDYLSLIPDIKVVKNFNFKLNLEEELEFDVLANWDGYLFLFEAKCTKTTFSPSQFYRAKKQIMKSVEQLELRIEAITENWANFRKNAKELDLPESQYEKERLVPIALTNVMDFTTWQADGVNVVDIHCVKRYFDTKDIQAFLDNIPILTIGSVRQGEKPNAAEFVAYIKNPPQVQVVVKNITTEIVELERPTSSDQRMGMLWFTYSGHKEVTK